MQSYRQYQQVMRLTSTQQKSIKQTTKCDKVVKKNDAIDFKQQQQQRRKITRTKTGCFCCRKRKKKCDEIKPSCSGCTRNNLQCVYPTSDHTHDKMAAYILSEMATAHNDVPQMSSPHHSDVESPLTSPRLVPQEPIKMILPLSMDTLKPQPRKQPMVLQKTCISIKSLLN